MKKAVFYSHVFPAVIALFLVGPIVYWCLDNTPPVDVKAVKVVNEQVARGEAVVVRYTLVYHRLCSGDAQRLFVDSTGTLIPIEPYRFQAGTGRDDRQITLGLDETIDVASPVPYGTAPGETKYQTITEFYCNPLQRILGWGIIFKFPAVTFTITDDYLSNPDKSSTLPLQTRPPDNPLRDVVPPLPDKPWKPFRP